MGYKRDAVSVFISSVGSVVGGIAFSGIVRGLCNFGNDEMTGGDNADLVSVALGQLFIACTLLESHSKTTSIQNSPALLSSTKTFKSRWGSDMSYI